ncbi:rCG20708 [Rattus norvegicus]|uniref:RCG20708 n=1 Tax=Rattus norvegicus TaxID=10116 RepID=A6JDJ5_RAT|nr:rCG20708 [Rattus norvegicus]
MTFSPLVCCLWQCWWDVTWLESFLWLLISQRQCSPGCPKVTLWTRLASNSQGSTCFCLLKAELKMCFSKDFSEQK